MVTRERINKLIELAKEEGIEIEEYFLQNLSLVEFHEMKVILYTRELKYKKPNGDLINIQKAVINELEIIKQLKELEEENDLNKATNIG